MAKIVYSGPCIQLHAHTDGLFELRFDYQNESANRFNRKTLDDLRQALDALDKESARGLLLTTGKDHFIMGADITEFTELFKKPDDEFLEWVGQTHALFNRIEDLPYPTVSLIHGFALGGGFEVTLATSYRIATPASKIGLPESKLGIFPGWGGCVRFPRLVGADNAIEWIASGNPYKAEEALKLGAIDAIVAQDKILEAGLQLLRDAGAGKFDWKGRAERKKKPLALAGAETAMTFQGTRSFVAAQAGPNYPAPVAAIDAIAEGAKLERDGALKAEARAFVKVCKTPQAAALVSIFLADQWAKRAAKKALAAARPVKQAAVLGAGIMGGGIAYQSASSKIPVVMKDIRDEALALGMKEAAKLLEKRVERGQMKPSEFGETLARIRPTLSMSELKGASIVVEAVVENEKVKSQVLSELESAVSPDAILTSNTSTISISRLSQSLKRPENFCGMHFFNPVHRMPLVEVIRGEKSSDAAIATAVAYASAMGKTPIVVGDCPGFLVNRVLFPYFGAFLYLVRDGVPFEKIDKVMEKFGWPMGPAYLLDVVGIDTAHHALEVMAAGFPDRMTYDFRSAVDAMYESKRYGQKNGKGFFAYSQDAKGRPVKAADPEVATLLKPIITGALAASDDEILQRMMLAFVLECSRCLEDKIVATPTEVDLSMLYGLGFPPFRGGPLRWADSVGASALLAWSEKYRSISPMYEPTAQLKAMASAKKGFYS